MFEIVTFWVMIMKVLFKRRSHGSRPYKTPANQSFSFGCSIRNCRVGVLHPAEKDVQPEKQGLISKVKTLLYNGIAIFY